MVVRRVNRFTTPTVSRAVLARRRAEAQSRANITASERGALQRIRRDRGNAAQALISAKRRRQSTRGVPTRRAKEIKITRGAIGGSQRAETKALALQKSFSSGSSGLSRAEFLRGLNVLVAQSRASSVGGQQTSRNQRQRKSFIVGQQKQITGVTSKGEPIVAPVSAPDIGRGGDLGNIAGLAPPKLGVRAQPTKFEIIGGRAVPIGAKTTASDLSIAGAGDTSFQVSKIKPTGDPAIDRIFALQRITTVNAANEFRSNRNLALGSGATDAEANEFARVTSRGLPKDDAEAFNIIFQKAIIEKKATQIEEANRLIKLQTTEGSSGQLDDLKAQLDAVEPRPATVINISTDPETGEDLNPRRTAVLIDNALLTGNSLDDLQFTLDDQPFIGIDELSGKGIDTDLLASMLNVNSLDQALNPEDFGNLTQKLIDQQKETLVQPELIAAAKKSGEPLDLTTVQEIITEGEIERDTKITEGVLTVAEQQAEDFLEGILDPEVVEDFSDPELQAFLDALESQAKLLEGQEDFITELLVVIEQLRNSGGESRSGLFESLFSLIAELQAQLAFERSRGQLEEEEDPFGDLFAFLAGLNQGVINFIGGIFK